MKRFIAIITKSEFSDLLQFGETFTNSERTVELTESINEAASDTQLFKSLTHHIGMLTESMTRYIVITFSSNGDVTSPSRIAIEDLEGIYPLDEESKRNYELTFDERIHFCNPIWEKEFTDLMKRQLETLSLRGIDNLARILELEDNRSTSQYLINQGVVEEAIAELVEERRPKGKLNILSYLLKYDRHSFYPKGQIGFFMDAVHIFCNWSAQHEILFEEGIAETNLYRILDRIERYNNIRLHSLYSQSNDKDIRNKDKTFTFKYEDEVLNEFFNKLMHEKRNLSISDILSILSIHPETKDSVVKLNEATPGYNYFVVATLYLSYRNKFHEGFMLTPDLKKRLDGNKNKYQNDYILAIDLLGIMLGYINTADCYYETIPLKIFDFKKHVVEMPSNYLDEQKEANHDICLETLPFVTERNKPDLSHPEFPFTIIERKKSGKGWKKPTVIKTDRAWKKLLSSGSYWKISGSSEDDSEGTLF